MSTRRRRALSRAGRVQAGGVGRRIGEDADRGRSEEDGTRGLGVQSTWWWMLLGAPGG